MVRENNRVFNIKAEKVDQFLNQKGDIDKVLNRFFAHTPKSGVRTPLKCAKVTK